MVKTNGKFNFIEVCAGGGGLSSGLIKSGFTPLLLNDINKDCCATLKKNHKKSNVVCSSMNDLDITKFKNKVDLLTGGVPCQSFSQAGKRNGLNDPKGDLMLKFIDLISIIKPKIFMIENVKGLLNHDSGTTIKKVIKKLNKDKLYKVKYKLLNSVDYNVPQKRERVFIVGILRKLDVKFKFPKKKLKIKLLKDVLYNVPKSQGYEYNDIKKKLFKLIKPGGCWVDLPIDKQKSYLGNSFFSGGGKRGILRRMSMDEPSLTLLCSPSQKRTERCHPSKIRPFNIREYARIQTFDDNYEFVGSISSQYKQIGNAVPVKLAEYIGKKLIKTLKSAK